MSADNGLYLQTTRSGRYGVSHYFASDEGNEARSPDFESPSLAEALAYGYAHAKDTEYGLSISQLVQARILSNLKTFESL